MCKCARGLFAASVYELVFACVRAWRIPIVLVYSISFSLSLSPSVLSLVSCVCERVKLNIYACVVFICDDSSKLYSTLNWYEVLISLFFFFFFFSDFLLTFFKKKREENLYIQSSHRNVSSRLISNTKQLLHRCALCHCVITHFSFTHISIYSGLILY